jgi:chromosome transmission fidelity protein 1
MCINKEVTKLGSDSSISEMCLEMQKSKSKKSDERIEPVVRKQRTKISEVKPCQFHSKMREEGFADHALGKIRDIESLITLGEQAEACPYYATRRAVNNAQVIAIVSFPWVIFLSCSFFLFFVSYFPVRLSACRII